MRKYRNVKVTTPDGLKFDSKAEYRRYTELLILQKQNLISDLVLQPKFDFFMPEAKKKIFTYIADFKYWDIASQKYIIEDVKGMVTPVYRLKKKIIEAQHGIIITEIH